MNTFTEQDEYNDWLQRYTKGVEAMSKSERNQELRENYAIPEQLHPDYLDYLEEWEFAADEVYNDLVTSFTYAMAVNQRLIHCGEGHTHMLALYPKDGNVSPKLTYIDDPQDQQTGSCWRNTIRTQMTEVKNVVSSQSGDLPITQHRVLRWCFQYAMTVHAMTPDRLPFETFKQVWWDLSSTEQRTKRAKEILANMPIHTVGAIELEHQNETRKPQFSRYFVTNQEIVRAHEFHNLIRAVGPLAEEVIAFTNKKRRKLSNKIANISIEQVRSAISRCALCLKHPQPVRLSTMGIYGGLPGVGKTTALTRALLIGYDTDWIGLGCTWREYSPLLRLGIPIITNQINNFVGCGLKIVVIANKSIRRDGRGRPMGRLKDLYAIQARHPKEIVILRVDDKEHFSSKVIAAQMIHHQQRLLSQRLVNPYPGVLSEIPMDWYRRYTRQLREVVEM